MYGSAFSLQSPEEWHFFPSEVSRRVLGEFYGYIHHHSCVKALSGEKEKAWFRRRENQGDGEGRKVPMCA